MHSVADNLAWIEALSPWPEEFGLGRMRRLLAALGDPQEALRAVHVVGTNGKTTTTRMCAALLAADGKTVGAYTSPHVTEEIWSNLPGRESRLIVAAWPEPDESFASDAGALDRVQEAAGIFRRSGVLVELEGDEQRIFSAVVKPERVQANGNEEAERERLRKEIARAEGMLANERFVANAPEDVVAGESEKLERYRRELDALGG